MNLKMLMTKIGICLGIVLMSASHSLPAEAGIAAIIPVGSIEQVVVLDDVFPGEPGEPIVEKIEIDSGMTADRGIIFGDSFRLGNFERPFIENEMVYHEELDLVRLLLSEDDDFYYFTLEMSGTGQDGFLEGFHGIEIDTDRDQRGDFLLMAKGTDSTQWAMLDVMLLEDADGDVGGSRAVLADSSDGNGYEKTLFGGGNEDEGDLAWVRVDPQSANNLQLALKKTAINEEGWFWKGWAGASLDPALFDHNDRMSEARAGSPVNVDRAYPLGALNMLDSTCWIVFNLRPTGDELNGCYQKPKPAAEEQHKNAPAPSCECPISESDCGDCGGTWLDGFSMCNICLT